MKAVPAWVGGAFEKGARSGILVPVVRQIDPNSRAESAKSEKESCQGSAKLAYSMVPGSPGPCSSPPDSSAMAGPSSPRHRARQESARPDRKRFLVNRMPSGEMATVNGSPSISISRRMVLSSLVVMRINTPDYPARFDVRPSAPPSRRPSSPARNPRTTPARSEEHKSELQSRQYLVCRLL